MPAIQQVAICGVGLIGASFGMALRSCGYQGRIVGSSRPSSIAEAKKIGAIDEGFATAEEAAEGSDLILLCAPAPVNVALLARIAPRLKAGALVTDVGSTKREMVEAAKKIFGADWAKRFLAGHPMAGKESSGAANAEATLYRDATWIFTPERASDGSLPSEDELFSTPLRGEFRQYLRQMQARILIEDPVTHDRTLAYVSHLPQLLSTALAATVSDAIGDPAAVGRLMGGGLRGMIRLAASHPQMWSGIVATNRANIDEALAALQAEIGALRSTLADDEAFTREFERARAFKPEQK